MLALCAGILSCDIEYIHIINNKVMIQNQSKETEANRIYMPPICEEVPVWAEGPLCGSNEPVNDIDGEW
jgi:hypothetical protein